MAGLVLNIPTSTRIQTHTHTGGLHSGHVCVSVWMHTKTHMTLSSPIHTNFTYIFDIYLINLADTCILGDARRKCSRTLRIWSAVVLQYFSGQSQGSFVFSVHVGKHPYLSYQARWTRNNVTEQQFQLIYFHTKYDTTLTEGNPETQTCIARHTDAHTMTITHVSYFPYSPSHSFPVFVRITQ